MKYIFILYPLLKHFDYRLRDLDLEIERPLITDLERECESDLEPERERRPWLYDRERDREGVYDLLHNTKLLKMKYKYLYKFKV